MAMTTAAVLMLAKACAPMIDATTTMAIVHVESSYNEFAIGVVGGALERQPRTRAEAIATMRALDAAGWDYSVGLGQINRRNFERLGLTHESALDGCANLSALQVLLQDCYARAQPARSSDQQALRAALSCYYSGNFQTGFDHGYVQRVVRAARAQR